MKHRGDEILATFDPLQEAQLERLALLFSECAEGRDSLSVAREVAATNPDWAPACWKLFAIWEDYGHDDPAEALAAYQEATWKETELLSHPPEQRAVLVDHESAFQTRELALRLLMTDEHLWHVLPEATLEVSELAVRVSTVAFHRRGGALRLVDRPATSRSALPELETWIRSAGHYVNALRIRGDFARVRRHVDPLEKLTRIRSARA